LLLVYIYKGDNWWVSN